MYRAAREHSLQARPLEEAGMALTIQSRSFQDQGPIPVRFTADGKNISPELSWSGVPEGAKSLALIVDDPDAPGGTYTHWILFNIPPTTKGLPEGTRSASLPKGTGTGENDAGTSVKGHVIEEAQLIGTYERAAQEAA